MQPYTYLIGWSKLDRWYYGVQYNNEANPKQLWSSYFTSSDNVKLFREQHGEPDVIEVRRVFNNPIKARRWEATVLRRIGIYKNERWLNEVSGGANFHRIGLPGTFLGRNHKDETKIKIGKANKGKLSGDNNPSKRPDVRQKISKALTGKTFSNEHRQALSKVRKGIPKSEEFKQRVSETMKLRWQDKSLWIERNKKISIARRNNKNAEGR